MVHRHRRPQWPGVATQESRHGLGSPGGAHFPVGVCPLYLSVSATRVSPSLAPPTCPPKSNGVASLNQQRGEDERPRRSPGAAQSSA